MKGFCSVFAIALALGVCTSTSLPSSWKTCKRSDPNKDACLKDAIQDALAQLKKGLPEIKFPVADPVKIPSLTIGEGTGAVHVVQKYKNVELFNVFDLHMDEIKATITDTEFKLQIKGSSPELYLKAEYDFNGSILVVPITGVGPCKLTMKNMVADATLTGKINEKEGKKYVEVTDIAFKMDADKVEYQFDNLFNGDERLGTEMNKLLNDNWKDVFVDVKAGYEEGFAAVFKQLANIVFSKIPYDEIFPQ